MPFTRENATADELVAYNLGKREARDAYRILRLALCDIEGGVAGSLDEAKRMAAQAVGATPPTI